MNEQIKKLMNIFKISRHETRLYLSALNFDKVNLTDLSKKAGIPRTAAYGPIKNLLKEGLLISVKIKKRTFYQAVSPKNLKYILDRKQVELEDVSTNLEKQIDIPERELSIAYYEGISGIELASDIWLENSRDNQLLSWEEIGKNIKQHGMHQLQSYIDRRVKKGVKSKVILSADPHNPFFKDIASRDKEELRKCLVVDPKKYPVKSAIGVMDDGVVMFTFGDNPFAILIKNKDIATTMKVIHQMFWDRYE